MKMVSFMLIAVFSVMLIITPFLELFGAFIDMVKINSAIVVSSRVASHMSSEDLGLRDLNIEISEEKFERIFQENMNGILQLKDDYMPDENKGCTFNQLKVDIEPMYIDKLGFESDSFLNTNGEKIYNCFKIKIRTKYKFKTDLMARFASGFKNEPFLSLTRIEMIKIVN